MNSLEIVSDSPQCAVRDVSKGNKADREVQEDCHEHVAIVEDLNNCYTIEQSDENKMTFLTHPENQNTRKWAKHSLKIVHR